MSSPIIWCPQKRYPRGKWLQAKLGEFGNYADAHALLKEVALWCLENNCGRRMSYDLFQFQTKEQMTVFLLKWS